MAQTDYQSFADKLINGYIRTLPAREGRLIVAIDGPSASAKTTLAAILEEKLRELGDRCTVFHMDDYFLRPEQRTPERLAEAGGNVDRERFLEEILIPVSSGAEKVSYRPFNCHQMTLLPAITTDVSDIVIVEGSYSCHPDLWDYYDLHVYLDITPEEQEQRLIGRCGEKGYEAFRDRWIPLEEKYFRTYGIRDKCEVSFGRRPQ